MQFSRRTLSASTPMIALIFGALLCFNSIFANQLWLPINGPSYPQRTEPGRVLLSWQLPGPSLIQNGTFDQPLTNGWTFQTSERVSVGIVGQFSSPGTTNRVLQIRSLSPNQFAMISQQVSIPQLATSAVLSWRLFGFLPFDAPAFRLEIRNLEDEVIAAYPHLYDVSSPEHISADLSPFAGKTVRVVFSVEIGANTGVLLDDVRLALGPIDGVEFDVYLGNTSNLTAAHLLGRTGNLTWDATSRVQSGINHWRVDVRVGNEVVQGAVWRFSHSTASSTPTHLLLHGPFHDVTTNEHVSVRAVLTDPRGAPSTQRPTGPAILDVGLAAAGIAAPGIRITEIFLGVTNAVEFMNVSDHEIDISGWRIVMYVQQLSTATYTNALPAGTLVPPGGVFTLRAGTPGPGAYPNFRTGRNNTQSSPMGVALFSGSGALIDFVHMESRSLAVNPGELWMPPAQSVENWIGPSFMAPESNRSALRIGSSDRNDKLDWVLGTNSIGVVNAGLIHPFGNGIRILSGSHRTFTNANATAWTNITSAAEPATNAYLVARYRTFHARQGPFDISALPRAELILPGDIVENSAAPVEGKLRLPAAMTNDVRATLLSDSPNRLSFTAEVKIPAGSLETTFQIATIDDNNLSGPQRVGVSVQSEQVHAIGSMLLLDDEMAGLILNAPSEMAEGGVAQAAVQIDRVLASDLEIRLSSDYTPVLAHPYFVTIPAGQTNVAFALQSPENPFMSGPKQVTLRAIVPGWPAGERTIHIGDNEPATLTVTPSAPSYLETSYHLEALTISLGGLAATNIPLTIQSSDRTELAPVTNATIRAGNPSVVLPFHLLGDELKDGTQPVTLTVSAPGFDPVIVGLEILDDDPASFEVNVTSGSKFAGVPFPVTLRALDINGENIQLFQGHAALTASNTTGLAIMTPAEAGPFPAWGAAVEAKIDSSGGQFWIRAEATNGATGLSAPFRLLPSPLAKTLVGPFGDLRLTADGSTLVASAADSSPNHSNNIVIIEPRTGEIVRTIPTRKMVGADQPGSNYVDGKMAVATGGGSIFVIVENGTMVQQFAWESGELVREWALGTNEWGVVRLASALEAVPGQPEQVAVAQVDGWNERSTRIYELGLPLPNTAPFAAKMMLRLPPEASLLYAYSSLYSATLGDSGFTNIIQLPRPSDFAFWDAGDVQLHDGLVHFTTGAVYDPASLRLAEPYAASRGNYPRDLIGTFAFDTNRGRVFFTTPRANGGQILDIFDIGSRQVIRRIDLAVIPGYVARLYHLDDMLVAHDTMGIHFLRSSLFGAAGTPVTLHLSRQATNNIMSVGQAFSYSLAITNAGTSAATEITVDETLPPGLTLLSAETSFGRVEKTDNSVRWIVDDLPAGAGGVIQISVKPAIGGIFSVDSALASYEWNNSTNSRLRTEINAQLNVAAGAFAHFPLGARSIAYDGTRNLVYASINPGLHRFAEKIVEIEPQTGRIVGSFDAGPLPWLIAVSDGDEFLWAADGNRRLVRRYTLPTKTKDLEFQLRTHPPTPTFSSPIYDTTTRIEPIPGHPRSLAVLQLRIYEGTGTGSGGIAIYDDAVQRHLVGLETPDAHVAANQLVFDSTGTRIYGYAPPVVSDFDSKGSLELFSVEPDGVRLLERKSGFAPRGEPAFALSGGRGVTSDGSMVDPGDFAIVGSITNSAGERMLAPGGSAVTLHPGNRASFVQSARTYFADLETHRELGAIGIPLGQDLPIDTLAVGDQLIFLTAGGSIYFVRSEHLRAAVSEPPVISAALKSGELALRFGTQNGLRYRLQSAPSLDGGWTNVGEAKSGTGGPLEFQAGVPNQRQRFYRIVLE